MSFIFYSINLPLKPFKGSLLFISSPAGRLQKRIIGRIVLLKNMMAHFIYAIGNERGSIDIDGIMDLHEEDTGGFDESGKKKKVAQILGLVPGDQITEKRKGCMAGEKEVIIDGVPCLVDGVSRISQ
jgi:hypothetical protein